MGNPLIVIERIEVEFNPFQAYDDSHIECSPIGLLFSKLKDNKVPNRWLVRIKLYENVYLQLFSNFGSVSIEVSNSKVNLPAFCKPTRILRYLFRHKYIFILPTDTYYCNRLPNVPFKQSYLLHCITTLQIIGSAKSSEWGLEWDKEFESRINHLIF